MDKQNNSGYLNSGYLNSGNRNSGNRNSGDWNSGNRNSGDRNSGYWNSGYWNSGDRNSGYWNSGNRNSGNWNPGDWNSGNRNSGDWNSGNWNSGDWNSGFLNTDRPPIRIFNKETDVPTEDIEFPDFFFFDLTVWVGASEMTDDEKNKHPSWETVGGYLKTYDYKEAWRKSWENAGEKDRAKLFALPNFDPDIFYEISGIDVRADNKINIGGKEYRVSDIEKVLNMIEPIGE